MKVYQQLRQHSQAMLECIVKGLFSTNRSLHPDYHSSRVSRGALQYLTVIKYCHAVPTLNCCIFMAKRLTTVLMFHAQYHQRSTTWDVCQHRWPTGLLSLWSRCKDKSSPSIKPAHLSPLAPNNERQSRQS